MPNHEDLLANIEMMHKNEMNGEGGTYLMGKRGGEGVEKRGHGEAEEGETVTKDGGWWQLGWRRCGEMKRKCGRESFTLSVHNARATETHMCASTVALRPELRGAQCITGWETVGKWGGREGKW